MHSDLGGGPQGCGLGLAIVDHTMRGHGGFVGVDSEPGTAARSRCTSPCRAAARPDVREPLMKRILVIEDEPQMLLGLRDNLELEGYEVQTAADGDEGLSKAGVVRPDLVHPRRHAAEEERLRRLPRAAARARTPRRS